MQSANELEENLSTYREQLQQVNELLVADPENEEYKDMVNGLNEVIQLTEELLVATRAPDSEAIAESSLVEERSPNLSLASENHIYSEPTSNPTVINPNGEILHNVPGRLSIGTKVQAVWSEDGEWYNATIESITSNGYIVAYNEWGNKEEVDIGNIRVLEEMGVESIGNVLRGKHKGARKEEKEEGEGEGEEDIIATAEEIAERTRLELKRKIEEAGKKLEIVPKELPPKLRIHPDDTEEVRAAKKKKIHAFKSKQRLEVLETTQNKRQNAWQQFQSGGKKKSIGYFTGRKKESIFKSPDDPTGKVGVTRSGHGMTEFQKREKYLNLKKGDELDD